MGLFKKEQQEPKSILATAQFDPQEPAHLIVEEWVWISGYKGTNKDLQCHGGYQYEVGKSYKIQEGETVEACKGGFHLCLSLYHVFRHYGYDFENRFFKVKALVRKKDLRMYGKNPAISTPSGLRFDPEIDKLAAKEIELLEEITYSQLILDELSYTYPMIETVEELSSIKDYRVFCNEKIDKQLEAFSPVFRLILTEKILSKQSSDWKKELQKITRLTQALTEEGVSTDMKVYLVLKELEKQ